MITFQDYLRAPDKTEFLKSCIAKHKTSPLYLTAEIADEYDRHINRTIVNFQKLVHDYTGRAIPDIWSAIIRWHPISFHVSLRRKINTC